MSSQNDLFDVVDINNKLLKMKAIGQLESLIILPKYIADLKLANVQIYLHFLTNWIISDLPVECLCFFGQTHEAWNINC